MNKYSQPMRKWTEKRLSFVAKLTEGVTIRSDWFHDSGCSRHKTRNPSALADVLTYKEADMIFGDGYKDQIIGKGKMDVKGFPELRHVVKILDCFNQNSGGDSTAHLFLTAGKVTSQEKSAKGIFLYVQLFNIRKETQGLLAIMSSVLHQKLHEGKCKMGSDLWDRLNKSEARVGYTKDACILWKWNHQLSELSETCDLECIWKKKTRRKPMFVEDRKVVYDGGCEVVLKNWKEEAKEGTGRVNLQLERMMRNLRMMNARTGKLDEILQIGRTPEDVLGIGYGYQEEGVTIRSDWFLDSGCSRHKTRNPSALADVLTYKEVDVIFGDGHKDQIIGKGKMDVKGFPKLRHLLKILDCFKQNSGGDSAALIFLATGKVTSQEKSVKGIMLYVQLFNIRKETEEFLAIMSSVLHQKLLAQGGTKF
ncbi:hypothetical protein LIER_11031 [Lithospermum erythrorhizon]|uniref:Retrovirus-related Pol polyprotein from transposon TNT 1-94-like beta-barrel domain-containing protein n=1 Tax=Lithospermum erythrorhizon TaxID=34254 RepID=A0AAV3PLV5_LITER